MKSILQQAPSTDETLSSAAEFFRTFGIAEFFNRSAGTGKGIPPVRILQFLFALVFLRKTFFDASSTEGRGDDARELPALGQGHVLPLPLGIPDQLEALPPARREEASRHILSSSHDGEKRPGSDPRRFRLLEEEKRKGGAPKDISGSVLVEVDHGKDSSEPLLAVKVVFVRNRKSGAKRERPAVPCTDISVPDEEVVRIYGKRWSMEVFFKTCKSVLRLSKEFETGSCDSMAARTSIVFPRYMMLSFELKRSENDPACGELFRCCCEELEDISYVASLALLPEMLKSAVRTGIDMTETILERMFTEFVRKTPGFPRNKIGVLAAFSMS